MSLEVKGALSPIQWSVLIDIGFGRVVVASIYRALLPRHLAICSTGDYDTIVPERGLLIAHLTDENLKVQRG